MRQNTILPLSLHPKLTVESKQTVEIKPLNIYSKAVSPVNIVSSTLAFSPFFVAKVGGERIKLEADSQKLMLFYLQAAESHLIAHYPYSFKKTARPTNIRISQQVDGIELFLQWKAKSKAKRAKSMSFCCYFSRPTFVQDKIYF